MGRNIIIAIVAIVIIAAAGYFFLLSPNSKTLNKNKSSLTPTPTSTSNGMHSAVSDLTIQASEYQFSPLSFAAVAGKKLTITVKNTGKMAHDLSFPQLNAKTKMIQPGKSETITVTPEKPGMYEYICTVPGHAAKGMRGILMVQPASRPSVNLTVTVAPSPR